MSNFLRKNTKIVCTIGPASWDPAVLTQMVENGMNVARINGAFADVAELHRVGDLIRSVSPKVALMLDIKGTEVRLNRFGEAFQVNPGDIVEIGGTDKYKIFTRTYPGLINDLKLGDHVLFDDGNVEAFLKEKTEDLMKFEIIRGGTFKEGKSINTPGIKLNNPPLTETDKVQIAACAEAGWEFVAASFVRNRKDAEIVKEAIGASPMQLIAKIENAEGVDNIDEILEVVDGVMVARGDMGVEMSFEKVPFAQKELIAKSNFLGKPVITATQMLESMIEHDRPTRAEITDIANAILDGTDAVMLSAESSAGKFPAVAVGTMSKIAKETLEYLLPMEFEDDQELLHNAPTTTALTKAAAEMAIDLGDKLDAVLFVTRSGLAAKLLSRHQIPQPIYAFTKTELIMRQLLLSKGIYDAFVYPGMSQEGLSVEDFIRGVVNMAKAEGVVSGGQTVLVAGHTSKIAGRQYFPAVFTIITVES
jgi:pyruvate kinase